MARNPFENPVSLTAARKAYAMSLFDMCYARVARDLDNDTTTEGVAIPALAQIVAAYTPHAGKGHAEDTRLWVADQVAALRTPDAAQEAQAQEAQAQEAQAQEAQAQEAQAPQAQEAQAPQAQEAQAQEAQAQEAPAQEAQEAPAQEAPAQEAPAQEKKLARRKAA
jgi:FtsZ-interacting cell division protein ZipA